MKGARYHVPDRGAIEGVPDVRARIEDVDTVCPDAVHEVTDEADLPLYLDIRRDLHMRLAMGEYTTGAAIPSEAKLAEQYGTTKVTVRNALDGLEEEGLIVRVQGKGTFATHGLEGSVTYNPRGFRDSHRHYQRTPSVRVLEATVREAQELKARDARLLRVDANDPALGLTCVSYDADGLPLEFVRSVSVGESASYLVRK